MTNQCHDITVFPEVGLAAGACSGNGILLDISRSGATRSASTPSTDKNFAYWHSATFNNDGTKVIFTDEWGGGTRPRCRATDLPNWGANAIFDIVDSKLQFGGYYKMPAPQTEQENCVAHNGSLDPGARAATSWCRRGIRAASRCSTSPTRPTRSRSRSSTAARSTRKHLITGGYWSTYWYNGHIYGSEIARGIDVFRLHAERVPVAERDRRGDARAARRASTRSSSTKVTWPASARWRARTSISSRAARAFSRSGRRRSSAAMDRAEQMRSSRDRGASAAADQLTTLATQLEADAASASGRDQMRLKALADTLKARAARLR